MEEEDSEELSLNLKDRRRKKPDQTARPVRIKKKPQKFNTSSKKKISTLSFNKKANSVKVNTISVKKNPNTAKKDPNTAKKDPDSAKVVKKPAKKRKYRKKNRPAEKKLQCEDCGRKFHFNCQLQEHRLVHTGEKPYVCDVCDKAFNTTYSLKTHKYIHTNEKPFKCAFCPYACRDSSTLRKHQLRHVGIQQRYQCKMCDKEFKLKDSLKIHVAEFHLQLDVKKVPCQQCDKLFKSKASLARHVKYVHLKSMACKCPICDKEVSSPGNLGSHMLTHQDARPYVCNYCHKGFKSSSTLRKHEYVHKEAEYSCTLCQREFTRPERLKNHYSETYGPYKRNFDCSVRLYYYVKVHNKVKRVQCDYCKVKFLSKNYLIKHIREKHGKKKKLKCDMCGFTTRIKPGLIRHIKGHKNDNDNECRICHKIFKRHVYLKLHYQRTHNVIYKTKQKAKPLLKIKEEPLDDEKSIDLFEIEKEEPLDPDEETPADIEVTDDGHAVIEARPVTEDEKTELTETILKGYLNYHTVKMPVVKKERKCSKYEVNKKAQEQAKKSIAKLLAVAKQKKAAEELERTRQLYNERMKAIATGAARTDQTVVKFFKKDKVKGKPSSGGVKTKTTAEIDENSDEKDNSTEGTENKNSNNDNSDHTQKDKELPKEYNSNIDNSERVEDNGTDANLNIKIDDNSTNFEPLSSHNEDIKNKGNSDNDRSAVEDDPQKLNKSKTIQKKNEENLTNDENILSKYEDSGEKEDDADNSDDDNVPLKYLRGNKTLERGSLENTLNNNDSDEKDEVRPKDKTAVKEKTKINKLAFNAHQCYTCFKLYPTKEELMDHCKDHFDICNLKLLKKCPLCDYVTKLDIKRHVQLVHHIDLKYTSRMKDKEDNTDGSRYYYEIDNPKLKKLEVIPSIKNLNKIAYQKLDEKNRAEKSTMMTKTKLVKKGKEWVVATEKVKVADDLLLPEIKDLKVDAKIGDSDTYLDGLKKLYHANKKSGKQMVFPCQHCEKICQNLAALKLHLRKHDPNKKPFKPKKWKHKLKNIPEKKTDENIKTDYKVNTGANILDINKIKYLGNHKINPDDIIRAAKMFGKEVITADQAPITEEPANEIKDIENSGNRMAKPQPIKNNHKCDPELQEFYRNCIRGEDIEFWQFLKIFNKMDRENIKDFKDLEGRYDYGIGHSIKEDTVKENTSQIEKEVTKTSKHSQNTRKLATAITKHDKGIKNRSLILNKVAKTHRRVIRLTKEEHRKRILIQKKLRESIAQSSNK